MRAKIFLATILSLGVPGISAAGGGSVPEPETLALLVIGAAAVAVVRWLKKK